MYLIVFASMGHELLLFVLMDLARGIHARLHNHIGQIVSENNVSDEDIHDVGNWPSQMIVFRSNDGAYRSEAYYYQEHMVSLHASKNGVSVGWTLVAKLALATGMYSMPGTSAHGV